MPRTESGRERGRGAASPERRVKRRRVAEGCRRVGWSARPLKWRSERVGHLGASSIWNSPSSISSSHITHQHPEHRADGEAGDGVRGERLDPLGACKGGALAGHAPTDTSDTPRTPLGHPGHPPLDAQARGSRRGPLGRPPSIQGRPSEGTTAVRRTRRPTPISLL